MDEIQRLRVKRRSCKGSITKLLAKVGDAMSCDLNSLNSTTVAESQILAFSTTLEQLKTKRDLMIRLDGQISDGIKDEEELEAELDEADSYLMDLEEKIAIVEAYISKASKLAATQKQDTQPPSNHPPSDTERMAHSMPEKAVAKKPTDPVSADIANVPINTPPLMPTTTHSRLPKLTLPTFNGNPLKWQTFWDSFTAAVDRNQGLSQVQKFSYLRAQLEGDAARAISGLPLTDDNYEHSVTLLKERFGQPYKLVDAHQEALLNVPAPSNSLASLQSFYDTIQSHMRSLSTLGTTSDTYGTLLTRVILGKLPPDIKIRMARDHYDTEWTIDALMTSVLKEIRIFEAGQQSSRRSNSISTTSSFHTSANRGGTHDNQKKDPICVFCKGMHKPNSCTTVSCPKQRLAAVKNAGLCFNCLARHKVSRCPSKFTCRECHKKHHTSLCQAFTTISETPPQTTPAASTTTEQTVSSTLPTSANTVSVTNQSQGKPNTSTTSSLSAISTSVCLLKTAIANISAGQTTVEGHILFDEGAQRSFITQELANQLHLQPVNYENISVSSFGEQVAATKRLAVTSILIQTLNNGHIPVSVLIVAKLAAPIRNSVRAQLDKIPYLHGLPLAHPVTSDENFHISILIGADFYWQFIQDRIIRGDGPTAVESRLGYLLSGPLPLTQSLYVACSQVLNLSCFTEDIGHDSFWQIESMGTSPAEQTADTDFLQQYIKNCITVEPSGTYSLKFPWKTNHPVLPSNYTVCAKRTRSMVNRLAKTPQLLHLYSHIIEEQEKKGFIEKIEDDTKSRSVHYIPHHPVKKESATTPIRIVYDCSCKLSPSSPSLNDCLNPGPPFLNDLGSILLRFRQHNFAFSADIEKAFLHVHLDEIDRDFTRFLWLSNPTDPTSQFVTFRFKVVLFGATCSPFMLNAALSYHLQQNDSSTSRDLLHNIYVDNVVSGSSTEEAAVNYFKQSRSVLGSANFNLRSWASNSPQLNQIAHVHEVADATNPVKVLGLWWDTHSDTIRATPDSDAIMFTFTATKREILKWTSSIFDPLGLLTPVTIAAKLFLQQLWQLELQWDMQLTEELSKTWYKIAAEITQATTMPFPRQCTMSPDTAILHIFSDASPQAYGAAAYLVQGTHSAILISKSRAAPLKQHSLPRLELMAAVLGTRLYTFISTSITTGPNVYFWSDSQIVLSWITSKKTLKPFVNNRVQEIRSISTTWKFCPSADNPADLLTRGISYHQLKSSTLWRHGPTWLNSPSLWPAWPQAEILLIQADVGEEDLEPLPPPADTSDSSTTGLHHLIDVTKFSKLNKVLAITAYVCRFLHNVKHPSSSRQTGPLTTSELSQANLMWIHNIQHTEFSSEIANLQSRLSRLPLVRQLKLFLDDNNLLRCGGRIHNAPLSELARFPYLLPSRHHFTTLVILRAHLTQLHSGVNATLTILRQSYWIPSARQRIKSIIRRCVVCKKSHGQPYTIPDPPPLVKSRVSHSDPFTITGVDFTGALFVRTAEGERKVYLCLFTCAVCRAVHLEIVTDLTAECFLQAFRRFAARRSLPKLLISDNGSTFLAAAEELTRLFSSDEIAESLAYKGVEWKFIPKRAPWFGGFWERLIGLMKSTLKKTLGRTHATIESLQTIIVEIEALMNDRPLTHVSPDPRDPEPITPAHLVYGRRITTLPHYSVNQDDISDPDFGDASDLRRRARAQAAVVRHFWTRWKREYLTALRETHKITGTNEQRIKVGDVVLIHDETPRIKWRLAVIESLNKGADGLVRSADIRTTTGKTNRPIARLYPLEVTASEITTDTSQTNSTDLSTPMNDDELPTSSTRPVRNAAKRGRERVKQWTTSLCGPLEDVSDSDEP